MSLQWSWRRSNLEPVSSLGLAMEQEGEVGLIQIMESASDLQCPKGEEGVQVKGSRRVATAVGTDESGLIRGWHHHSRIVRVSRATGGKDRHSKVLTSKGLRDRRVRLSVPTAIQFYDIQDRLGYNQPSKAVEWLIKAAANSISELPSLNGFFTGSPTGQLSSDERRTSEENATEQHGLDSADIEDDGDPHPNSQYGQQNQNLSLSKSACTSTSETSRGSSSLSLPGSELCNNPVRARERIDKEKKDRGCNPQPLNLISQSSSFTELLTGGISMANTVNATTSSNVPSGLSHQDSGNCTSQWSSSSMDSFNSELLSAPSSRNSSRFADRLQTANNQIPQALPIPPPFTISTGNDGGNYHAQYSFVHEGFMPIAATASSAGAEYNLNFMISSVSSGSPASGGLSGYNRGTLQSNSSSQQQSLPSHLQRFSTAEGQPSPHRQNASLPFFIGTAAPLYNHNSQYPPGLHGQLQLYYGHDTKEEPKS